MPSRQRACMYCGIVRNESREHRQLVAEVLLEAADAAYPVHPTGAR